MEWINIHTSVLEKEVVLDTELGNVGAWVFLQRFCHSQENGGRIKDAKAWDDRKCLRTVHLMKEDLERPCGLWKWEGNDLVVEFYPVEKEREVAAKRRGGSKGARQKWTNFRAESLAKPSAQPLAELEGKPLAEPMAEAEAEAMAELLRKGMEGNGKEEKRKEGDGGSSVSSKGSKKKNSPRPGAAPAPAVRRPFGWCDGDAEFWWTGELAQVERALDGALTGGDEKNAARLREVLRARRGQ